MSLNHLKILAFAGSARRESFNKKLVRAAGNMAADTTTVVTWIDLKDFSIPLYDGDHEADVGQPEAALTLRALFREHDAIVIASPEYNGFFSPLLKNAVDWLSRPLEGEERHAAFKNKPFLLLAATRGESGGGRGLKHLRQLLQNLKAEVFEQEFLLPKAHEAFGKQDNLEQEQDQVRLFNVVREFVAQVQEKEVLAA